MNKTITNPPRTGMSFYQLATATGQGKTAWAAHLIQLKKKKAS